MFCDVLVDVVVGDDCCCECVCCFVECLCCFLLVLDQFFGCYECGVVVLEVFGVELDGFVMFEFGCCDCEVLKFDFDVGDFVFDVFEFSLCFGVVECIEGE